ncbi:MAG TPA: AI-2E family transporter [Actinomycetota bacterium]|nr:AI-2E family transporter [Actinomycetota bacterium]
MSKAQPPRLPSGERLRRAGVGAWSIIGILVLTAITVWLLFKVRVIFPPLVLALLIIYLLNPFVNRLEERKVPRTVGAVLCYVVVGLIITLVGTIVAPFLSRQVQNFSARAPELQLSLIHTVEAFGNSVEDRFGIHLETSEVSCLLGADEIDEVQSPTTARCDEVTEALREEVLDRTDRATEFAGSIFEVLLIFILAPLLALYLLIDLPHLQRDIVNLAPEHLRDELSDLGSKVGRAVGGFFRGQLLVALLVGIMSSFGFWAVGLDFWLPIGAIAGFTNLIPLVGPFIGGSLGFLVGTITEDIRVGLLAALVALIVQQIDNHVISPNVMRRTVQLHPVTVMLSLLAGGTLAGFWGVLLAVPGVAVAKLLLGHLWATRVLGVPPSPFSPVPAGSPPSVVSKDAAPEKD